MIRRMRETSAVLAAVDMGLGKTVCALTVVSDLLDEGEIDKALVVAPLRVATNTWPTEIEEWSHLKHLRYAVLCGPPGERAKAAADPAPIHIINRENLVWLHEYWGSKWPYDMLIYDEASRLKAGRKRTAGGEEGVVKTLELAGYPDDPTEHDVRIIDHMLLCEPWPTKAELSEAADVGRKHIDNLQKSGVLAPSTRIRPPSPPRISEFGVLAKRRSSFGRVIELSGTPSPNGLEDLWGPAYILDQGRRLGASKTAFLSRWFKKGRDGFTNVPFPHAEREILTALSDVMFSMKEQDYRQVLPVLHNIIEVNLPKKALNHYREFKKELYSEEYDVEAVNNGVLTNKLLQFANGSMYRGEEKHVVPIHDEKLKALESIIEEAAGAPVLIAYSFQFDCDRIKKRFPNAVIFDDDENFVKKWNKGKIAIGLAHPASIGHGLNLQYGGNIAVWYGLTWSLELYQQFNKRLPRPGQTKTVIIHHILAKDTEDSRQYRALNTKGATQDRIIDAVRYNERLDT